MAKAASPANTVHETLSPRLLGKMSGALAVVCGALVMATAPAFASTPEARPALVAGVGAAAVLGGILIWFVPWQRWPRRRTLVLAPPAFVAIALFSVFSQDSGLVADLFYLVAFVWLGLAHRQGASLALSPLAACSYLESLRLGGGSAHGLGLAAAAIVVPCGVLLGETVAWGSGRLRRSEEALAVAEARFRSAFEQAPIGMAIATTDGRLLRANTAFAAVIGLTPDELAGVPIRDLTHPDDWDANAAMIEALVAGRLESYQVEKRLQHADGDYVWVVINASCVRDTAGRPLYMIGQIEDVTERRAMQGRLAHAATHDLLTGLPNRTLFMDRLEVALGRTTRSGRSVAVIFLDVDRFKLINDNLGHDVGDRILQAVADRLRSAMRDTDTLSRLGGDEFTVICEDVRSEANVLALAERLAKAMEQPLLIEGGEIFVSLSVGLALSLAGSDSGAALLRNADVAMYRAKGRGPSHIEIYREDDEQFAVSRLRTSSELHRVLERDELELHYQPVIHLQTQTLIGMEALVRWRHPTRGLLFPADFIPLAEDSGMIVPLGAWILAEACRQVAEWSALRAEAGQAEDRLNIGVNVSALQLADPNFPDQVAATLAATGVNPDRLWLEITESTLMRDADDAVSVLYALRDLGVHIEIDDFGTGYSSLGYLRRFPVEVLKIDRSFVSELDRRSEDAAIVRAVIGLGESLGLAVIAEGVERPTQAAMLDALGCRTAEGYLFGKPLPAARSGNSRGTT